MNQQSFLTRRRLLAAGLAVPLVGFGRLAMARAAVRFRGVAVDVAPLDRYGGAGEGRMLAPALLDEMRTIFADRIDQSDARAPLLTARINSLFMAAYDGAQTTDFLSGNDNIEGDGIVSAGGSVLSSTHILTELPPSYSGSLVTPDLQAVRYRSIAHQFAYWLRREMGL